MRHDLIIRGGLIHDGTGAPGYAGALGIRNGRISAIGPCIDETAGRTIDAAGLAVAPGFIDIKTHSDFTLPINPRAESKVRQGVTTEIVGHCGFSVAPCLSGKAALLRDYLSASAPWLPFRETTFQNYLDEFPATSVNAGMLVGHNTLRLMVMEMAERAPSAAELEHMQGLLEEGLRAGALGLSSGLFTAPGGYAERDELIALCRVLKRYNASYFTHLRDESNGMLDALDEAIDIGAQCGIHVQVVHLKCSGVDNWGKVPRALAMMEAARRRGVAIDCDAYPYTAGSNPLKNILPRWVQAGGVDAMLARLRSSATREHVRGQIAAEGLNNWGRIPSWDSVQISVAPHRPQDAGRTIAAIAAERRVEPIEALCDFLIEDRGATRVLVSSIAEEDVRELIRSPCALVGSDGNCVADYGVVAQGLPHPRFYGTFPRVLSRYVAEQGLISLPEAIRKMTGASASALRMTDRGLLREGWRADVVLFDPDDFKDRATYAQPHQYPSGGRTSVIVNGVVVIDNASHTGATPGVVLRRGPDGAVL